MGAQLSPGGCQVASRKAGIPKPARTYGKQRKRVDFHVSRRIYHTNGAGLQVGARLNKAQRFSLARELDRGHARSDRCQGGEREGGD